MDNLQNGIQFETFSTANIENGDCLSINIAVLLAGYVFDNDVTGVPCDAAACECDHQLIFFYSIAPVNNNTGIYVDETKNKVIRLNCHSSFHIVFLTRFRYIVEYLNSTDAF